MRGALLRWYRRVRRDLPWRRTRDPYAVWVSEVMLQQTRVAAVVPYYERFVRRFPDVRALSRAPEDEVLALWSGLGYYRRARGLLEGARIVVERHGGRVPDAPDALLAIPGIGRYTAGAIASVAFGREEPILDGNVRRVLSRLFAVGIPSRSRADRLLWEIAGSLVRGPDPGDLNQALMELGALVCTPRSPSCTACPLTRGCKAREQGEPESYPPASPRPRTVEVRVAVALLESGGRFLLERPGAESPLRGAWDLPAFEIAVSGDAGRAAELGMRRRHGIVVRARAVAGRATHAIVHRRLRLEIVPCRLAGARAVAGTTLRWLPAGELDASPVSGATRKALALVSAAPPAAPAPRAGRRAPGRIDTASRP